MTLSGHQPLRIDDLDAPRFSDEVRAMLQSVAGIEVQFTESAVLDAARVQTGLDDFGEMEFTGRLGVIL